MAKHSVSRLDELNSPVDNANYRPDFLFGSSFAGSSLSQRSIFEKQKSRRLVFDDRFF